jgi:hypothetical protein
VRGDEAVIDGYHPFNPGYGSAPLVLATVHRWFTVKVWRRNMSCCGKKRSNLGVQSIQKVKPLFQRSVSAAQTSNGSVVEYVGPTRFNLHHV